MKTAAAVTTAPIEHYCHDCGAFDVLDIFFMCAKCYAAWVTAMNAGLV